jgi:hypothetical protein
MTTDRDKRKGKRKAMSLIRPLQNNLSLVLSPARGSGEEAALRQQCSEQPPAGKSEGDNKKTSRFYTFLCLLP